jgi:hypothetical protein
MDDTNDTSSNEVSTRLNDPVNKRQPLMGLWGLVPLKLRGKLLSLWGDLPGGDFCKLVNGGETVRFRKDLMVIVSDGRSYDAMPVTFVSPQLIEAFAARMKLLGYAHVQ